MCISQFYHCCDQNTREDNSKEERFILPHSFRGFSPSQQGRHSKATPVMADQKQRRLERARNRYLKECTPCDLLPPARTHLLKSPEPPKIAPPTGDQALKT
jgi:hypothetical protein